MQNYYLTTFNKEKYLITEEQEKALRTTPNGTRVRIGNATINTSTIADITPTLDAKMATTSGPDFPLFDLPPVKLTPWTKEKKLKALRSMREGFLKGVSDRNNLKSHQSKMVENMDILILRTEKAELIQKPINTFKQVFGLSSF